ncbi:BRIX1 [Symbiodinium natans]|uniref:BRIX1 protein n=1 Tax=Symbiodinium natans TaxID=878477 RepID=A0A812QC86_9DINO|nr:BRIX1 [Symbiodinium natans]
MAGREDGRSLDPRSDNLDYLRQVMNSEVLPDLDNAVKDCVFGVISLIWLTLASVDSEEGLHRARELEAIADGLFFQFSELVEGSGWPLDPTKFFGYRQLLGHEENECGGSTLRVFVYNSTLDLTRRRLITGLGMMAAASHIHAYLERASCVVKDPETADLFFVPAYHGDQYNEFLEVRAHAGDSNQRFSHLARRRGQDHFFVVSANLPSWKHLAPLRNAILLTVESWQVNDDIPRWYSPWKDIMIPGYIDRWRIDAMRRVNKPTHERGFLMVFHGNHPGNHGLYVTHKAQVRTRILESFAGIPDCSVGGPVPDFFQRMGRTHFCLVPRGSSAWTIHLYESFFFGCIPVIISDFLDVPFQNVIDWPALSIKWPEDQVGLELLAYLRSFSLERIAQMKRRLEEAACFFDFHRGWGRRGRKGEHGEWMGWAVNQVALGEDCEYLQHGDGRSAEECRRSCIRQHPRCNTVNFHLGSAADSGDCVLRSCRDPAQPALTGGADGWQVWSVVNETQLHCSPYHAIFSQLQERVRNRPSQHGRRTWLLRPLMDSSLPVIARGYNRARSVNGFSDHVHKPKRDPRVSREFGYLEAADEMAKPDPYLMADAAYIQKDTRWRNKQRTLVFCSRGVTARFRHLCDDLRKLLPHHKSEPKFEKRSNFNEINEICELKNCNNVVFFEARKREDLYLWVGRVPSGPTMKFQVLNIHTTQEVRLAGNCLLGSRPIMYFDKSFSEVSYLKLVKGLFIQVFGTPRNHPKSKPFHDHIMCFYWLDKKIWFRHYQISPETPDDSNKPEKQVLTEIGPRFVLDPIRILGGSFNGQTLFLNPHYMSPTALRVQARKLLKNPYAAWLAHACISSDRFGSLVRWQDLLSSQLEQSPPYHYKLRHLT